MEEENKDLNQTSQTGCRTVLLEDKPSDTDAFKGPHDRIANAIANLITSENGGKAIALVGSLGSGKSTVVELLKSKVSKDDRVFTFNAWLHQGDPLRRSFLENLIKYLLGEKWLINIKEWEEEIDKLARRKEETYTTTEPILTNPGKLIAISALFLPLGYVLFDTLSKEDNSKYLLLGFLPPWLLGLLIVLLPVFIVAITWIISSNDGHSLLGLFLQKTRDIEKSSTIKTPDPTSIEFVDIFIRLMNEAFGNVDRKLIVVIDNLDRADPQEALTIWSTMRTFFELDNKTNPKWIERFWLLVPFDPSALKRLWKSEVDNVIPKDSNHNEMKVVNKDADLLSAFVDKTFQIKFPVPPPILSDWKEFFIHEISRAFQDHVQDDCLDIYDLYRLLKIKNNPPTPREIKLFINQVGAFHRIWGDEIPLSYQALYVIYKKELQSSKDAFLKPDSNEDNMKHISRIVGSDFPEYLAALHYNVERKKALQILIGDKIEDALKKGSTEDLKEIASIPGFVVVCENMIEDNSEYWIEKDPEMIATSALAFSGIEKETNLDSSRIWDELYTAIETVNSLNKLNETVGEGLVVILEHSPPAKREDLAKHILEILSKTKPTELAPTVAKKDDGATLDKSIAQKWKNGVLVVMAGIHELGYENTINMFKVPGDTIFYIDLMIELSKDERKDKYVEYFIPHVKIDQIVTDLTTFCGEGKFTEEYAECIALLVRVPGVWPWKNLITILKQRLEGEIVLNPNEIIGCVKSLIIFAYGISSQEAIDSLNDLSTIGYFLHHLHHANTKKDSKAIAVCIFPLLEFNPSGKHTPPVGQSNEGLNIYDSILNDPENHPDVIENLSEIFLEFGGVKSLTDLLSLDSEAEGLLITILENIVQREDAIEYITPTFYIDHYKDFQETVDDDILDEFLKKLISDANLIIELTQRPFTHDLAHLYRVAYENSINTEQQQYLDFLKREFKKIDRTIWEKELNSEGDLMQLLLSLVDNGLRLELTTDYSDALLLHADQIHSGKAKFTLPLNNSTNILSPLIEESRQTFLHKLCKKFIALSNNPTERILDYYGNELINSGVLKEESDDVVITLFSNIISRKDIRELEWVEFVIGKQPEIFSRCRNDSKVDFIKRLENSLDKTDINDVTRPVIEKIAKTLGIDPSIHHPKKD